MSQAAVMQVGLQQPVTVGEVTLTDVLDQHARMTPHAVAATCGRARWTYAQLSHRVQRFAAVLSDAGVRRGNRIAWLGQNCHHLLEAILAAARLGALVCPVNWRLNPAEVASVLKDLDPAVVLYQDGELAAWVSAVRDHDEAACAQWWAAGDESTFEHTQHGRAGDGAIATDIDPASGVLIIYTAAFGGAPAGAILTHRGLLAQSAVTVGLADIDRRYNYLNCGPLYHVGTLQFTFATFVAGGKNVFVPRADPAAICAAVASQQCHGGFILGPTITAILDLNATNRFDLSSLRVPKTDNPRWAAMTTPDRSAWGQYWSGYGQTELTGLVTYNAIGAPSKGEHGRPAAMTALRIVDPDDNDVAPGQPGEIIVRGATVCAGYHNRPADNARRMRGGWWHTGDLGRVETDGSLQFLGTASRMIKSAAENIYPAEVEAVLDAHRGIAEAAVIGAPDHKWVQAVVAIVVVAEGVSLSEDEVIGFCRQHLASYKKPRRVVIRAQPLPRKDGATDYDALDAEYGGGNYPGAGTPTAVS
jgi:acyl-CoA synthetase (AMP-forming)/AMP-acid ligase II